MDLEANEQADDSLLVVPCNYLADCLVHFHHIPMDGGRMLDSLTGFLFLFLILFSFLIFIFIIYSLYYCFYYFVIELFIFIFKSIIFNFILI